MIDVYKRQVQVLEVQQLYLENLDILQNHHQMEPALPYRLVQMKVRP